MQGKRVLGRCVRELVNKNYFSFLDYVVFVAVVSILKFVTCYFFSHSKIDILFHI